MIPWRVKNFLSDHFPLIYHLAVNAGLRGNSSQHWDKRLAETWDAADRQWPTKNELVASLTNKEQRILDVGCGNGDLLRYLQSRGYKSLNGLELSAYAVERLAAQGIEMQRGKLPSISAPAESFDVAIASQVLEHVIRRNTFLKEIRRVLKPGGHLFVFVPDDCLGPISEPEHVVKFDARSLAALLGKHFELRQLRSIRDANHPMPILFAHAQRPSAPT
jgi:2-polyprenyl-3-methyl-5-hydroxy-6-metoxy-1,4-benzoquinol methylase